MKSKLNSIAILIFLVVASCNEQPEKDSINQAEELIAQTSEKYAPDSRVALFDIEAVKNGGSYILRGESNLPDAVEDLKQKLKAEDISFADSIRMLPDDKSLEGKTMGIVKISVANLREEPKHSSQLVTQATLGTPVKIWKRTEEWYYIQTPDGYLSWVDHGGIITMDKNGFDSWKSSEKIIFKNAYGQSFKEASKNSQPVSDIVAGSIFEFEEAANDFYKVSYPDGREAFIAREESAIYSEWLSDLQASEENLVQTSSKLMGLPYLWGGTSSKGVDCSGFTKTIYFMNGIVIPRDASQQIREGKLIDSSGTFENLAVGDLLFFGRPATDSTSERVVHVGMWIGDNEFIHSSGDVHISSMDENAENFDEFNKARYLRTKRYLGQQSEGLTYLKDKNIFLTQKKDTLAN